MADAPVVHVGPGVVDAILAHARDAHPNECCGLLIGAAALVTRAWPAGNLTPSPTRYLVDPVDHFAAIRAARAEGREVVGAYHSHPEGPLEPSQVDLRDAQPGFLYLIASPSRGRVEAWSFDAGVFRPRPLAVHADTPARRDGPAVRVP